MTRVAIIGNVGGGKSVLSRFLNQQLNLPLLSIDQIQWKPGWESAPYAEIKAAHDEVTSRGKWIIDGWGPSDLITTRFERADTIILIDHPLWVHFWWAIKRQFKSIFVDQVNRPENCPMLPMTWPILKMIWTIHHQSIPLLVNKIEMHRSNTKIIYIQSPRQLRRFIGSIKSQTKEHIG